MNHPDPEAPDRRPHKDIAGEPAPTPADPAHLPVEPEFGATSEQAIPETESAVTTSPKV